MTTRKKTVVLTLLAALISSTTLIAQIPTFEWAKTSGGTNQDEGKSIVTDNSGNIYSIGFFQGTADFDPNAGIVNLTSNGNKDIFIQKLDANGVLVWVKQIGGTSGDEGLSIAIDQNGDLYCTGTFRNTVDFDPNAGVSNLTSSGSDDLFILKLDSNGSFIWVKRIGNFSDEEGTSITTDNFGSVYVAGVFFTSVDFDPNAGSTILTPVGIADAFILKLDVNGNMIWVKQMGGTDSEAANQIITDPVGNIFTIGHFRDTVDFDPSGATMNMISNGATDIFIQKLDSAGNFIWAKQFGGSDFDLGLSITTDLYGNIFSTGSFSNTVDFDPNSGISNMTSSGQGDFFVQKLDSNGNFMWAKQFGGIFADGGRSITTDVQGNVFTTGYFSLTIDVNTGAGVQNFTATGSLDAFIQKLDNNGNFLWAQQIGGAGFNQGTSIISDDLGNVYCLGEFSGTTDFDASMASNIQSSNGNADIYLLKLNQCLTSFATDIQTSCNSFTWTNGVTYFSSNNSATDTLQNSAGCDSIVTLNLTINSVSNVTTSTVGFTITANSTAATSYQWLDCNSSMSVITGETNSSYTATSNGNYAVEIVENGCSDTSSCVAITTVGLVENSFNEKVTIYPNPTFKEFSIEFEQPQKSVAIKLTSISGQLLDIRTFLNTALVNMKISHPSGVYFVEIINDKEERTTTRLIKR